MTTVLLTNEAEVSETQNGSTTAWINMQEGAVAGFVAAKGDAAVGKVPPLDKKIEMCLYL